MKTAGKIQIWALMALCWLAGMTQANEFDVPGIESAHLSPEFWIEQLPASQRQQILMTPKQIRTFNQSYFEADADLQDLSVFPQRIEGEQVKAWILALSSPSSASRVYADGRTVKAQDYALYHHNLALEQITAQVSTQWGLVVRRSDMRTFATFDKVFRNEDDRDLDRFQESGIFPGQAVAILHQSADAEWLFVQSYNYRAWVPSRDIALGHRAEVLAYTQSQPRLMVTGAKVMTNYNPEYPDISELQLDMGVSLPLLSARDVNHNVYGQNPFASYVVQLPMRTEEGQLQFQPALIARAADVHQGPLPMTRANLIAQSFKFLGERYGWGHDFNARDCTGFVGEIYRTFGIQMTRNSGQQGKSQAGKNLRFTSETSSQREQAIVKADIGDLLYLPGHVMLYLGELDGEPYVIHDVAGLRYKNAQGETYQGVLSGVAVTPLRPLLLASGRSYVEAIYNVKSIR